MYIILHYNGDCIGSVDDLTVAQDTINKLNSNSPHSEWYFNKLEPLDPTMIDKILASQEEEFQKWASQMAEMYEDEHDEHVSEQDYL